MSDSYSEEERQAAVSSCRDSTSQARNSANLAFSCNGHRAMIVGCCKQGFYSIRMF